MIRFLQWVGRPLTEAERHYGIEVYTARAERFGLRAYWEEFVLEAPDMGCLRRLWRNMKLYIYRRAERQLRADIARLRG